MVPEDNEICYEDFDTWPYTFHFTYNEADIKPTPSIDTIALDIDQTIGDVGKASVLFKLYKHFHNYENPPYSTVEWFFNSGGFRPYLKELILYLVDLRNRQRISKIIIITSINNYNGYVDWLCSCLESYCNVENLIDEIRDSSTAMQFASDGSTIKELHHDEILIDDKPYNIVPYAQGIGVTPYYCKVPALRYLNYFDVDDDAFKHIKRAIERDERLFDSNIQFEEASHDNELDKVITKLSLLL
jgi:hypothetical protein